MMDLCIQDSEKCVRCGIWKLRVHTFQFQYELSDHLKRVDTFQGPTPVPEKIGWSIRSYFKGNFFILQSNKQHDLKWDNQGFQMEQKSVENFSFDDHCQNELRCNVDFTHNML